MTLTGKGFYIWKIRSVESGNPTAIAAAAAKAGLSHVLIKIADGVYPFNIDAATRVDLVPPMVKALKAKGIQAWGWHYVYGYDPVGEARIAAQRILDLNLDGYVIDAEIEYCEPGKVDAAKRFMNDLRNRLPTLPIALSSYRFPSYHPQLPWKEFLEKCDLNMPQVYWEKAHNAAAQLRRCLQEFQGVTPLRPVFPTGAAYRNQDWAPTEAEVLEFQDTAIDSNLSGVNYYSWDSCFTELKPLWDSLSMHPWKSNSTPTQTDIAAQLLAAFNGNNKEAIANLYTTNAVHITAQRTLMGNIAIANWYAELLSNTLAGAVFKLTGTASISESSRNFTWTAQSAKTIVKNGSDTLGLINGKIAYHYTHFKVLPV